jgi:pyridoxine 4-dehydrogenase
MNAALEANKIPNGSPESVRQSVEECLQILPPSIKKIDIFQCARVDPKTPIETTMRAVKAMADEGKFGAVGLSEVRGETIKRA